MFRYFNKYSGKHPSAIIQAKFGEKKGGSTGIKRRSADKQDKSRAHFRCCPAEKHRTATPRGLFALRPKQGFSEIFYAQEQSYFGTAISKIAPVYAVF